MTRAGGHGTTAGPQVLITGLLIKSLKVMTLQELKRGGKGVRGAIPVGRDNV